MSNPARSSRISVLTASAVACSAFLVAACGGGGSSSATTAQYQSAYAVGRIAGFGSVVINGVHYDETVATVTDEDGAAHASSELKLGMMAEVEASNFTQANNATTATAQAITFSSLMRGPVESVSGSGLVVLGQPVTVTATTVFDDALAGGPSSIKQGDIVKVYGTLDTATGTYTATRIEPLAGARQYSLRGVVGAYDATAKTLKIGNAVIDVSGTAVPTGLKAGDLVRVRLQTTQANGMWVASSVKPGVVNPHDNDHSEVEGTISAFTSPTSFSVDGLPVDASKAEFPDGTGGLAEGARVEVEGTVVNGTLIASTVKLKTEQQERTDGFEVDGAITSVDATNSTFVVRGVTVSYAGAGVRFVGGTASDLAVNRRVEVKATLSTDGVTLNATTISFD